MSATNYEVFDNVPPNDTTWKEWRDLVESEGWTSDDHSVVTLAPHLHSTRTVVAKDKDGKYVGSVVWNEYDNLAFIGFYLLQPEHRGKGIGSIIWKRAVDRIPKHYTIGLRAVPDMAERYQSMTTPIVGAQLNAYKVEWKIIYDIAKNYGNSDRDVRLVDGLSKEDHHKLENFDKLITGRDRNDFLKRFHNLPFTKGACIFDKNGEVVAYAGITPTSTEDSHLFKLAPIYAENLTDALAVALPLINYASIVDPDAITIFHVLTGSKGDTELIPLLKCHNVPETLSGTGLTLFSREYTNTIDKTKLFIPNNNSSHFDA